MFKILGVDGRHYGPVTPDQVRQWLAENRANGQTLAQADGSTEWKPLYTIPEFAADFVQTSTMPAPPHLAAASISDPRASNKIPAGVCGILLGWLGVHKFILGYTGPGLVMLLVSVLTCFVATPAVAIIGLIEGIVYLTKTDAEFVRVYVEGQRPWF